MSIYKAITAKSLAILTKTAVEEMRKRRAARKSALRKRSRKIRMVSAKVMKMDVVIKRPHVGQESRPRIGGGVNTGIKELTRSSLRRMKLHFRNLEGATHIVTLTYPSNFPTDGKLVKYHLRLLKHWLQYTGDVSAAWFLEFQERGAPHYHLITDKQVDKALLSQRWYEIVGSGDEKHLRAGTQVAVIRKPHAIAAYVAKYAAKGEQKEVPADYHNVGRFWGGWGKFRKPDSVVAQGVDHDAGTGASVDRSPLEDSDAKAINQSIRSAKKLLKSRGFPVKDFGVYGFVLWGVGSAFSQFLQFYGYTDIPAIGFF